MLCHQCGSPAVAGDLLCPNCGAELTTTKRLKLSDSRGLRISQELKAIKLDAQHFPPGEEVATRFVLGEMIGKGPFGEVYRARDKAIDAEVAVKLLDKELMSTPLDEEKFLQATRAGRRLTQQNVVRLHDSGVHKGHPWVSMQLLEGLSLRKVLDLRRSKNELFALHELEPVVTQITLGLQHLSRDSPHGDLKPENVVFLPDLLKVTDSFLMTSLPAKGVIPRLKSNPYFAPELHDENAEPTARADVYSVGVIIGEMMFGADYEPGSRGRGELAGIDALVKRATAFDPSERYASVEALSEDLSTLLDTGALLAPSLSEDSSVPPPPPGGPNSQPGGLVPPAPPPGPAKVSEVEDLATTEYTRDLDQKLQDAILTRELGRDTDPKLPKPVSRTVTAAIPKPSGPVPAPRPLKSGPPFKLIGLVVAVVAIVAVIIATQRRDEPVENIGQEPEQLGTSKAKAVPPKPNTAATNNSATTNNATTLASNTVAAATNTANNATASTAAQTTQSAATQAAKQSTEAATPGKDGASTAPVTDDSGSKTTDKGSKKPDEPKPKSVGTDCPRGMQLVKSKKLGNYCVDAYEYPGAGVMPRTRVSWFQAKKMCESKGKRLCELKEWRNACGSRYPYGSTHDPNKCNTADEDGFERSLAKNGSFKRCRSRAGAVDMVGNAHEWVAEQRIAGGGFESDEEVGSCRYSSSKSPASSAAYIGFRCCKNPE